jgi:hypothetical protein
MVMRFCCRSATTIDIRSVHSHARGKEVLDVDDANGTAILVNNRDLIDAVFGHEGTGLTDSSGALDGERAVGHDFADGAVQPGRIIKDKSSKIAVSEEPCNASVAIQYQYSASMPYRASVITSRLLQRFANRLICRGRCEIRASTKANQLVNRAKHRPERAAWVAGSKIRG